MVRFEFDIADAFLPEDPVGHFVISFAAASNDLLMTSKRLFPPEHPEENGLSPAEEMALLRLALGQIWETHLLVKAGLKDPTVTAFIERLGEEYTGEKLDGLTLLDLLKGENGGTAPKHRHVIEVARSYTFHYPKPGDPRLVDALKTLDAQGKDGVIRHTELMPSIRFEFADEVMLRVTMEPVLDDEKALRELLADTRDTLLAILHLAQTAVDVWLSESGAAIRKTSDK